MIDMLTTTRRTTTVAALAVVIAACAAGVACGQTAAGDAANAPVREWVQVGPGATELAEIGLYRVGYQYRGKNVVWMPPSWSGGFTRDTGIAFEAISQGGRRGMLLHSPWRGGTGASFVEYALELPKAQPIALRFGIVMSAEAIREGDGATFSVTLTSSAGTKELMREHYDKAEPKDLSFDLSSHAGQRVVLRLQAEPGPKDDPSFDFSYFLEPRIEAGPVGDRVGGIVAEMTGSKAYAALEKSPLDGVGNRTGAGIVPGRRLEHRTAVARKGDAWELSCEGADGHLVYTYRPTTGMLDDVTVQVDGGPPQACCRGGGVFFEGADGSAVAPKAARLVEAKPDGDRAIATWTYEGPAGEQATVRWRFAVEGKSLIVEADDADTPAKPAADDKGGAIYQWSLGRQDLVARRVAIPMPYLTDNRVYYWPAQGVFVLAMVDWRTSSASTAPGATATYLRGPDGRRNRLAERGYVAVSADVAEVLPNLPQPGSTYCATLGRKLLVDIWDGDWKQDAATLSKYKAAGMDDIAVIKHVWQRYGYDQKLPDTLQPKNSARDRALAEYIRAATGLGYLFALHENYIEAYPDAPSYNTKDLAVDAAGQPWKAWYHTGTKMQSYALKPHMMVEYASRTSPEIHSRYGTNASFVDVNTAVEPWRYCDFSPDSTVGLGKFAERTVWTGKLFDALRDWHKGPAWSEGGRHWYWAGVTEGVEAQVDGGEDAAPLVVFDLLKIHPQMVSQGMGYYTRWLRTGAATRFQSDAMTPAQLDRYRAQTLAYGHGAFIGRELYRSLPLVAREYYLTRAVAAQYGGARVTDIAYEVAGRWVSPSVAAVAGVMDRLHVRYDSGLDLWINLGEGDWTVEGQVLPAYGFIARGSGIDVWTARRDGVIADYAKTPDGLFVDPRTEVVLPGDRTSLDVRPRLASVKYAGGQTFQINYEWDVREALPPGVRCFVHFQDVATRGKESRDGTSIAFYDDHELPGTPDVWAAGSVVADGPHDVQIPDGATAGEYDILIGLFPDKWSRIALGGIDAGANRYVIGRIKVQRRDGRVSGVESVGINDWNTRNERTNAKFRERMNPGHKMVDFGPVRTNIALRIVKADRALEVHPLPVHTTGDVQLDIAALGERGTPGNAWRVVGVDDQGHETPLSEATVNGGRLVFRTGAAPSSWYRVTWSGGREGGRK